MIKIYNIENNEEILSKAIYKAKDFFIRLFMHDKL